MATTRQQFTQKGFDEKEYDRYFHLHQAEYIRKKLCVIKFIAAYSPKLNVVEYVIHWIRQEVLHHADAKKSLQDFQKIIDLCKKGEILNKEQLTNILCHIENLVNKKTTVSAERE
jgi:hypothetical protein